MPGMQLRTKPSLAPRMANIWFILAVEIGLAVGFVVHQVEGTLVLTNVGGDVACPGEKIVLTCTIFSSGNHLIIGRWRELRSNDITFFFSSQNITDDRFGDFTITQTVHVNTMPQTITLASNATLREVTLSHDNSIIECFQAGTSPSNTTIRVAGELNS